MDFLEHAIQLDTYLVSEYPGVVGLGDRLFDEISGCIKISNRSRTKEALKIILINLFVGYQAGVAVRYSRRKSDYSGNKRYSQIYFSYVRVISVIDALIDLGYIEHWIGRHFSGKEFGRESRMAATEKLAALFEEFGLIQMVILREPPTIEDLVILRDQKGDLLEIPYEFEPKVEKIRERLILYNKFIADHVIEVRLPEDLEVSAFFLSNLIAKIFTGTITITDLRTNHDVVYRVDETEILGFRFDDRRYAILRGDETAKVKAVLLKEFQPRISQYNEYYKLFHHNHIDQLTIDESKQLQEIFNKDSLSMTGTISEIDERYQLDDVLISTTMDEWTTKRPLSDYGIQVLAFQSNYQYLHRVFNKFIDNGGRFYGAVHINLPKKVRPCIFIDGSPTVELDFSANHIRMLYHLMEIDYTDDPYQILCEDDGDLRPIYKTVMLVAINAPDEQKSIGGIRDSLRRRKYNGHYLNNDFIKACLEKVKEVHKPIAAFLNLGRGLQLQFYEGAIIDLVLMRLRQRGVPCLPVHDSFIVPANHEDLLHGEMMRAYHEVMGFDPVIKRG